MKEDFLWGWGREVEKGRYPFPNILALSWAAFGMVLLNGGPSVAIASGWPLGDSFHFLIGLSPLSVPWSLFCQNLQCLPSHILVDSC